LDLPGLGRYTAHAILTFAYDQPVPIVEANILRLLSRIFDVSAPVDSLPGRTIIWDHAASLVPPRRPGEFNSALIDLGATTCLPRNPKCGVCPVKPFCRAPDPLALPRKKPRHPTINLTETHAFIFRRGKILLEQCRKRWRGMWMLPKHHGRAKEGPPLHILTFPFTHHEVTLQVVASAAQKISSGSKTKWFSVAALGSIPVPSPHRRALAALLDIRKARSRQSEGGCRSPVATALCRREAAN
jgi:A/G-specific adenine glycosylase